MRDFAVSSVCDRRTMSRAGNVFAVLLSIAGLIGAQALPVLAQTTTPPGQTTEQSTGQSTQSAGGVRPATEQPTPIQMPSPLTLKDAIELALRLQPNVAQAVANREAAEQREKGAIARYYPTLAPTYQYLYQYTFGTVNQFVGGSAGTVPVQQGSTRTVKNAQVGLSFRLWDSGTRDLQARQTRQNLRSSEYGEENTRQTVTANVADTYFTVLRNEALVQVSAAQVARAKNTLDVVTAQVEVGVAARKDTLQAQADYLNAQVNLIQAQNNAAIAQANLKSAMGLVGGDPLKLAEVVTPTVNTPITATPVVPGTKPSPIPDTSDDAARINQFAQVAYKLRPDIAQSRQNVESAQTTVSLSAINTRLLVTTDLSTSDQFDATNLNKSIGNNRQVNLNVSYPLFDGGLVRSQLNANKAQARASEAQLANLKQQVAVEVEQAYRTLQQTRATLPAAEAAQQAANINYEAAIASQKEGVGSIVEVITAQTTLVQAQSNYVQAIYNFYAADARLTRAIGQTDRIPGVGTTSPDNPPPVDINLPSAPVTPPAPAGTPLNPAGSAVPTAPATTGTPNRTEGKL